MCILYTGISWWAVWKRLHRRVDDKSRKRIGNRRMAVASLFGFCFCAVHSSQWKYFKLLLSKYSYWYLFWLWNQHKCCVSEIGFFFSLFLSHSFSLGDCFYVVPFSSNLMSWELSHSRSRKTMICLLVGCWFIFCRQSMLKAASFFFFCLNQSYSVNIAWLHTL